MDVDLYSGSAYQEMTHQWASDRSLRSHLLLGNVIVQEMKRKKVYTRDGKGMGGDMGLYCIVSLLVQGLTD